MSSLLEVCDADDSFLSEFSSLSIKGREEQIQNHIKVLLENKDGSDLTGSVKRIRQILSMEVQPPIETVINCGGVPVLVNLLKQNDSPNIQFEAAWAISNIASGTSEHTMSVIHAGAVEILGDLISPTRPSELVGQVAWAIGNIAGNSAQERDYVLEKVDGIFQKFDAVLQQVAELTLKRNIIWAMSNLVRGKPCPPANLRFPSLPIFARCLHDPDPDVLADVCWGLSYLSDGTDDHVQAVLDTGCAAQLVNLLARAERPFLLPSLRCLGNLVTGDDQQTQVILAAGFLRAIREVFRRNDSKAVLKECCWALSNVTAGTPAQIQAVIDSGVFDQFDPLIQRRENDLLKEILWTLSNATSGGTIEQLESLFLKNVPLFDFLLVSLQNQDRRSVAVAMEGLVNILSKASQLPFPHPFANQISQSSIDTVAIVEHVKLNGSVALSEKATELLDLLEEALADISFVKPAKENV